MPFLALAPFVITVATSADAFFAGVAAWGTATAVLATTRRSPVLAGLAGLLLGALPYLSYGLLPLLAVPIAAVLWVRRESPGARLPWRWLVLGAVVVPALLTAGGFWWPAGVAATHTEWVRGSGDDRPYLFSFVADFAVLGVLVGPATAAAVVRIRSRPPVVLAGAALLAVLLLAVSGVTRLEVERIWLPFAPWIVTLCVSLRSGRGWLAVNAVTALVFSALVRDTW